MRHLKDTAIRACLAENASFPTIRWEDCLIPMLLMGPFLLLTKPLPFPPLLSALHFRRTGQRGTLIIPTSPNEPSSLCSCGLSSGEEKQGPRQWTVGARTSVKAPGNKQEPPLRVIFPGAPWQDPRGSDYVSTRQKEHVGQIRIEKSPSPPFPSNPTTTIAGQALSGLRLDRVNHLGKPYLWSLVT